MKQVIILARRNEDVELVTRNLRFLANATWDLDDIVLSSDIGAHQHEDVQLLVTKQKPQCKRNRRIRTSNRMHAVIESEDTRKNNESRKLCFSDC